MKYVLEVLNLSTSKAFIEICSAGIELIPHELLKDGIQIGKSQFLGTKLGGGLITTS
jgi:hypothetical protein